MSPCALVVLDNVALIRDVLIAPFVMSAFGAVNDSFVIALPLTFATLTEEKVDALRARMGSDATSRSRTMTVTLATMSPPCGYSAWMYVSTRYFR